MKYIIQAWKIILVMIVSTVIIYQLVLTVLAQATFLLGAKGSQMYIDNKLRGSLLILQNIEDPKFFQPRPEVVNRLRDLSGHPTSIGGLEPFITREFAMTQAARIASARQLEKQRIINLIVEEVQYPDIVNINKLNLRLETMFGS